MPAQARTRLTSSGCCHRAAWVPWVWRAAGRMGTCPATGGRGAGESRWRLRPRRVICCGCRRTHVLPPVSVLERRADAVTVIGAALAGAAAGLGHRRIAERPSCLHGAGLAAPVTSRAVALRSAFTVLL